MFRAVSLVDDLDSNRYIGLRFNLFHTWLNLFTCQPSTSSSMLSRHPVASLAVAAVLVTSPKGELRETWANFFTLRHNNIFIFGSFFSEFEQLSCRSPWHHYCQVWHEAWMNLPPICQLGSTTKSPQPESQAPPKKSSISQYPNHHFAAINDLLLKLPFSCHARNRAMGCWTDILGPKRPATWNLVGSRWMRMELSDISECP